MTLNKKQQLFLRSLAHARKPVLWIGQNGYTEALAVEVERALNSHQLVKVRINSAERSEVDELVQKLETHHAAQLIQRIGATLVIYRRNAERPDLFAPKDA